MGPYKSGTLMSTRVTTPSPDQRSPMSSRIALMLASVAAFVFGWKLSKAQSTLTVGACPEDNLHQSNQPTHISHRAAEISDGKTRECCLHKTPLWKQLLEIGTLLAASTAAGAAIYYATISKHMWTEMQEQSKTQHQQLVLSQRPWIKIVDGKTIGNNPLIPALSFQGYGHGFFPHSNQQVTVQIVANLKNIGHSVAFVNLDFELFFPQWNTDRFEDAVLAEERRFCDLSAKRPISGNTVRVLFPDDPAFEWHGAASQPLSKSSFAINPDDASGEYIIPIVALCANYRFGASSEHYQTRATYEVFHLPLRQRFFRAGDDVPAKQLDFMRDILGDDAD